MTDYSDRFVFRESVLGYLDKPEVRHAVNLLLDRKIGYLPQAFDQTQVTDFYTACLAARQTQIEFVQDMADLWHRIWRAPQGWTPVPLDPADEELSLDPTIRWTEEYFQRNFKYNGYRAKLWLWLAANRKEPSDLELGFEVIKGSTSVLKKGDAPPGWTWDEDEEYFCWPDDEICYDDGLDLGPFRAAAGAALKRIEQL